jgi:hypothetical protein
MSDGWMAIEHNRAFAFSIPNHELVCGVSSAVWRRLAVHDLMPEQYHPDQKDRRAEPDHDGCFPFGDIGSVSHD